VVGLDFDDSSWTDLPPALFKVLEEARVSDTTDLRLSEAFLVPGDRVTVLGDVAVEVHGAGERSGLRDPPLRRRIFGTDRAPVILRDADDPPA